MSGINRDRKTNIPTRKSKTNSVPKSSISRPAEGRKVIPPTLRKSRYKRRKIIHATMTAQSDKKVNEKITKVRKIKTTLVKEEIIVEETAKVEETTIQEIAHKEFLQLQKRLGHELLNTILLKESLPQ